MVARSAIGGLGPKGLLDHADFNPWVGACLGVDRGAMDVVMEMMRMGRVMLPGRCPVQPAVAEVVVTDRPDHQVFVRLDPHAPEHAKPKPRPPPGMYQRMYLSFNYL